MGETAASSPEMERKRKHMENLNSINQPQRRPQPQPQPQHQEDGVEEEMISGGGRAAATAITIAAADISTSSTTTIEEDVSLKEEDEEDPLRLSLSPYTHRRPRPAAVAASASPSIAQHPLQLLPPHGFMISSTAAHQDHHHRPFSSFYPPFGAYPKVVHHDALAHLPSFSTHAGVGEGVGVGVEVGSLLPTSISQHQSGAGTGTGTGVGASTSINATAPNTPSPSASAAGANATDPRSSSSSRNSSSNRRNPTQAPRGGKDEKVTPPFDWATDRRATVHSLAYLRSQGIRVIAGDVQCKRCDSQYKMEYDVESKFMEMEHYIRVHKSTMHDRAPKEWMAPKLPSCQKCGQHDCVKPIVSSKKRSINWLFLLLGKMLGCCTLEQLRYFCKHTKNHRTGAKDRVLYLTYLGICKQLNPDGPFDR